MISLHALCLLASSLLAATPPSSLPQTTTEEVRKSSEKAFKDLEAEEDRFQGATPEAAAPAPETAPEAAPEPAPEPVKVAPPPPPVKVAPPPAKPKPAVKPAPEPVTWDFETGDLRGWTKTGAAFDFQPTFGDNPTARGRGQASQHRGAYWIGGYEKRNSPSDPAGATQGDGPKGTLTSDPFTIKGPSISFLIGGGCDLAAERVSLVIDGKAALQATGKCNEAMEPVVWDVSTYIGKTARIEAVDDSDGGWGHINLDDVTFAPASAQDDPVDCGGGNIALRRPAQMSSTGYGGTPEAGVDGVKNGSYGPHSSGGDAAWWQVDLGRNCRLGRIIVYNRQGYEDRANSLMIMTARDAKPTAATKWKTLASRKDEPVFAFGGVYDEKPWVLEAAGESARWVRVQLGEATYMNLDEIEVFGPAKP